MKPSALFLHLIPLCIAYTNTAPPLSLTRRNINVLSHSALHSTAESISEESNRIDLSKQFSTLPTEAVPLATSGQTPELAVLDSIPTQAIETPSISKILSYTFPAIGVWLCSPILSMIDTAAVGVLSGTAQQAALNPAVSVTDYGGLVVAFMYTATTNLIAAAQQHDKSTPGTSSRTTTTLLTGLQLSILVGTIFAVILSFSAKTLIQTLIGNELLDPTVLDAALRYVRIRSLGMPAALVIGTAQSACLGMQDVKSPLMVLMAAAAINFMGDVCLVGKSNPWLGGAAGAAWATVFSQYGALYMFWRWMVKPLKEKKQKVKDVVDISTSILQLTGTSKEGRSRRQKFMEFLVSSKVLKDTPSSTAAKKDIPKSRGFLAGKLKLKEFLRPSNLDRKTAKEYLPFVIPVTTTSIGRISGYIAMSHVASSTLGTFDMAAHQIIFSIFCCLTPIVDGLSQVAQSFVPGVFEHKPSKERAVALSNTIMNFRKVGIAFGGVLLSLVACIPLISRFFTTDSMVLNRVNGAIPGVGLFLLVNGLMCAGEGSLLGQKDLRFLRNMYTIFFFTVPAYMLRLKQRSMLGIQEVSIGTMWAAFSTYNVIRTCIWHLRLAQLQRRTNRSATKTTC